MLAARSPFSPAACIGNFNGIWDYYFLKLAVSKVSRIRLLSMSVFKEFEVIPLNCLWVEPEKLINIFKVMDEQDEDRYWHYVKEPLDLKNIFFPKPPQGGAHLPGFAVWQPCNISFGSVLIPNYGDELIQLIRHLNRRFQIRYFSAHLSRDHKKEGLCRFEHTDETGAQRVVHVIHDQGWQFYDQGRILPFENPLLYQNRRIADRLTPALVIQYLKSLGWDLEADDFWKSESGAWIGRKMKFK